MNWNTFFNLNIPSPIEKIEDNFLKSRGITLMIKREDLIHPVISGNKWRKLKYNLLAAIDKRAILSFGGAYSNHLHALAAAGKMMNKKTIGIVRGEEHLPLNPTLAFVKECGMDIYYIDRQTYRNKTDDQYLKSLKEKFGDIYIIPEGGTNNLAVVGCKEIIEEVNVDYDYIVCPCGSGGTISGLIAASDRTVIGISALNGVEMHEKTINKFLPADSYSSKWWVSYDYHFGGYAKTNKMLLEFMDNFQKSYGIQLDPIYNGKMLYGIYDLIKKEYFKKGERIIALHTGGLQGIEGFNLRLNKI